jgi:hypothetical protein
VNTTDPTTPRPTVRWTEHGPEPVAPPSPASEWDDILGGGRRAPVDEAEASVDESVPAPPAEEVVPEDRESLRARLAAKGLVRDQPAINIRELAGDAPPRQVVFEPEPIITTGNKILDDELGDPEELEPELPGPTSEVRCASCRTKQRVPDTATGYRCASCAKVWRWAECSSCHDLNLTIARQESWRCTGCGSHTRSWWRTPTKAAEHRRTAEARATDAAERRRREAYEKARRRGWMVLAVGAIAIIATAFGAVTFTRNAAPVVARGANAKVCEAFRDVQRSINGNGDPAERRAALDALAAESVDAIDRIRLPAQRLAGAGQPGDKPFDDAARALDNACTP